jgi:hypothetical protein
MKKLLNIGLAVVILASFANTGVGQQKEKKPPTTVETTQPTTGENKVENALTNSQVAVDSSAASRKLVTDAIASSIVTLKGKAFPTFAKGSAPASTATGGASCEPYDIQSFSQGAPINLEGASHQKASYSLPSGAPQLAVYSPQNTDFLVASFHQVITSAGPPYETAVSSFPAGYAFLSSGNYSSVKSTMHSFVGSLNIPGYVKVDLTTKLDTMISNISSYSYSLGANYGTLQHTAQVHGTGIFNTTVGHAWFHGYIDGTQICAPAYLHDQNALTTRLKTWVKNVILKLPQKMDYENKTT